jgi:hypothetical protein
VGGVRVAAATVYKEDAALGMGRAAHLDFSVILKPLNDLNRHI